jgi:hypothetical protein
MKQILIWSLFILLLTQYNYMCMYTYFIIYGYHQYTKRPPYDQILAPSLGLARSIILYCPNILVACIVHKKTTTQLWKESSITIIQSLCRVLYITIESLIQLLRLVRSVPICRRPMPISSCMPACKRQKVVCPGPQQPVYSHCLDMSCLLGHVDESVT